ncbi:poly(A) RNA polymerase, mitochondrial isoform X2 [Anoplophora glabripennis]|uniref:poly(A) RNA polymerase, mitochondrial isoform X2 n=1 Tax=Anoplophora glabripennis TaxID=217634 RepID=UPI000873E898|nr:poly(A) RNA polymerase, mitochondrial isoform X2 [Anoplophora glabripennis]
MYNFFYCCAFKWRYTNLNNILNHSLKNYQFKQVRGIRRYSQESKKDVNTSENDKFIPFLERIDLKRAEARRSILVQVQSALSYKELHTYCSSIGTVRNMFHYTTGVEPMHFIIVEFSKESDVTNILSTSSYVEDIQAVPTQSQFLWFRACNRKLGKLKQSKSAKLSTENGTEIVMENVMSEQMKILHSITKLNDVGSRLRFLTARQIESTFSSMFPYVCVYPFGSSVNGYGRMGCDLDLVLRLLDKKDNAESRLVFHSKAPSGSERSTNQRHMEAIGDLIHLFLPGCSQVRRILQARVPIIKYHQQLTDVECDLSMANMSGVHMSDFLYIMGELDDRVRPLVFTIRKWAKEVGLTNASPGRWMTNFSLTLLVLAFLQKPPHSPPVLPSLNTLVKLAGSSDKYITEDGVNCSFLRDLNKFKAKTKNIETLESLLSEFFEYYSQFDFTAKAVCLNEAVALTKPEFSAMYIINPLERGLNVSKNVSIEEVERFKEESRNAAWMLESQESKTSNWGLLSIFENRKKINYKFNFSLASKQSRLMNVRTLFDEDKEEEEEHAQKLKEMQFKNEAIKQEIKEIKKETQDNVKSLENSIKRQKSRR